MKPDVNHIRKYLVIKMLHSVDRMNRAIMDEDHEGYRREVVWQAELRCRLESHTLSS